MILIINQRLIKELYDDTEKTSSIVLMGDTAQSIYSNSWMNHSNSFKMVGLDMSGRSRILSKNHRNTYEIANAAASLIAEDDEIIGNNEYVAPETLERHGDKPTLIYYKDKEEGQRRLCEHIKNLHAKISKQNSELEIQNNYGSIGILARRKSVLYIVKKLLDSNKIPSKIINKTSDKEELSEDCIKLLTFHSAKGLEFPVVFLVGLSSEVFPCVNIKDEESVENQISRERRLLYVSMTRAVNNLYMLAPAENSSFFLHEIDESAIEITGKPSKEIKIKIENKEVKEGASGVFGALNKGLHRGLQKLNIVKANSDEKAPAGFNSGRFRSVLGKLYQVNIEDYRFQDSIDRIYSDEEIVRQWVLDVLITKLGVPVDMIDIEYVVRKYSASGRADVVVFANIDGEKQPIMICETKSIHLDTEESFNKAAVQLKQYVDLCDTVKYVVLTNGKETFEYRVVGDKWWECPLPSSYEDMIPEKLVLKNLRNDSEIMVCRNCRSEDIFTVISSKNNMQECEEVVHLPMLGRISAGPLKEVYNETLKFTLPELIFKTDFSKNTENYFILEVDGCSMIEADIEPDDLVLVRKTSEASNRDIVVALAEGEVTMKRLVLMNDNAILMPENKDMSPIMIDPTQLRINGVVEAVIKRD